MTLLSIIFATFIITLCVLLGASILFLKEKIVSKITLYLVALSAGALMGGAFLHLLPEASEKLESHVLFTTTLISFIAFYIIEKLIHFHHCHKTECTTHSFGYINLIGDSIHNFIDGVIIAGAFLVSPAAGFEKKKAIALNYLVSLTVVLGGVVGYFAFSKIEQIVPYLLPIAAGGFIYLASSDLIPELKKESGLKKSLVTFIAFLLGIGLMYLMSESGHSH